ncbi:MAG: HK97 gp10 family phage protein [Oscillospiraceae bacterium]|nr:HK97 gp10 family phage protein [Oscillospiraceae bacterium]
MELGDALQRRMEELAKRQPMIDRRFAAIAEGATLQAIEEAQDHTPHNTFGEGEQRGVHMITGGLAQHWSTDSQTAPIRSGSTHTTALANDKEYASYVNDGHRMDRHFVPGLYVGDDGLLSMDPARDVGMMVGTKTRYVPGLYMREKGVDKYRDVAESELRKLAGEVLE